MSEIREWLAKYGNSEWTSQLERVFLDLGDFDEWSEQALDKYGLTPEQIEYLTRGVRQMNASKRLLTRPQNRQISVLFVDLVGSTELGERLGDERAIPLKNIFRRVCRKAMEQFGGNIMYSHHDEVVACFGFPIARERDAERAVRAALQINEQLAIASKQQLQVRSGVSTARSVVGAIDPDTPEMINAGSVVGHASRLSECAEPAQLLLSEVTHSLIRDVAATRFCGEQTLNGFKGAQPSWTVDSLSSETETFERARPLPMVGRDRELATLHQSWQRVCEAGRWQTICLSGEAGIGKSRLVQELRHQLPIEQSTLLFLCSPYHTTSSLYPVAQQLAWSLGLAADATDEQRRRAVAGLLASVDTDVQYADAQLGLLLGVRLPNGHRLGRLPSEVRKQWLFELLRDIMLTQVANAPLLVIVEDIHWTDPTTLQLMHYLAKELRSKPVMLVLTARPGFELPKNVPTDHSIEIGALDRQSCGDLIRAVDPSAELPEAVVDTIAEQCDGIPMYVEEVTRAQLSSGSSSSAQFTPKLSDLLIARLDSVGSARSTAQLASVIGRSFSIDVLEAASDLPAELVSDHIALLRDKGLLQERLEPEPTLLYRHALLRDCAYETLLQQEKKECHSRVADALIESGSAPEEVVARHLAEAERDAESIVKWQEAARKATQSGAYLEATAHLEAAMALLPTQATDIGTRRTRQELLLRMLPALLGSVSYGSRRVKRTMDEAIALSQELGVDSRIFPFFYGRWINTQAVGKHAEALAYSEEFMQLAQMHGDAGATTAAHINTAWSAFNLAQLPRASQLLATADNLSKKIRKHGVGFAYSADAIVGLESCRVQTLWCLGDITQCRESSARAISRSEEIRNSQSVFLAAQYAGAMTHALLREWDEAHSYGQAMVDMQKIAGAKATGQFYSSLAAMHLARNTELLDVALGAQQMVSGMGFKYMMPFWLTCIAEVVLLYGDDAKSAAQQLDEVASTVDETGEKWFWAEVLRLRALIAIRNDQPDIAERNFQNACELAVEQHNASFGLRAASSAFSALGTPRFRDYLEQFSGVVTDRDDGIELRTARRQLAESG